MIIPINDGFRIEADSLSWMVQKFTTRKRNGKTVTEWKAISWHSSLQSAVQNLADRMVRASEAQSIAEAIEDVKRVSAELCEALQPRFQIEATKGVE